MSLLRDATRVGFVWPPAQAGRRGQGMGMGSPAAARTHRSVWGWFQAVGRDGGSDAGSRAGRLRWGIVNGETGGCGVRMEGGGGEPLLVLVLNRLWHDLHYIRE